MLRKILAVLAGYSAWTVLWFLSNSTAAAVSPDSFGEDGSTSGGVLGVFLVLSVVFSLLSGKLTRAIGVTGGPVLGTGLLLLGTGIPIQLAYWEVIPLWYHLLFLALLLPATLLGGMKRTGRGSA